jgi:hypothetical protein
MSDASPHIEWYLAREGEQYGPLSDSEMRKFVELGHLRPTDLVWRHGFADWRPAAGVFSVPSPAPSASPQPATPQPEPQPAPQAQPQPQPRPSTQASPRSGAQSTQASPRANAQTARPEAARSREQPQRRPEPSPAERSGPGRTERTARPTAGAPPGRQERPERAPRPERGIATEQAGYAADIKGLDDTDDHFGPRKRGRLKQVFAALTLGAILAAGTGWYVRGGSASLPDLGALQSLASRFMPSAAEPLLPGPPVETLRVAPFKGLGDTAEVTDQTFQQAALWRIVKQEFPEWYDEHVKEAVRIKTDQRDDAAVEKYLIESIVALRRKNADQALAASPAALRTVASTFLDNLKHLTEYSVDACYGFISQGEMSPKVIELMSAPDHVQPLQRQMTSVFEAVAEGRKSPQTHTPPRKADYDALTQALTRRGWTDADLQLFSDPRALARAKPEVVCKMVQDWFAAQLSIKEPEVQLRLLVESLRPVVAG